MSFKPTAHPVFLLPSPAALAAMGPEKAAALLDQREAMIRREEQDPYTYGYEPAHWRKADELLAKYKELWIMGGNRAGKSEYATKRVLKLLFSAAKRRAWAFSETSDNSREWIQPVVWKYLPPHIRGLNGKRGTIANVNYSQKGGFTENTFVLPNGSQETFKNYAQDLKTIEGGELDGAWCDELVPLDVIVTVRYRLVTRGGWLLCTFTAKEGYTATVKSILSGARTIEEREAELLPILGETGRDEPLRGIDAATGRPILGYRKLPVVQETADGKAAILYFWTQDNPFGGYQNLVEKLKGKSEEEILMRAYGIPTKAIGARLSIFNDTVHVIPHERVPRKGTRYMIVDPCGGRTWCMAWFLIDEAGRAYVYREWPDQDQYIEGVGYPGPWAEPDSHKADGRAGSAQKGFKFGILRYKEEIDRLESGTHPRWKGEPEIVFERWMDSRYGDAPRQGKEAEVTLIDECAEVGLDFLATPGKGIDEGIDLINNWFEYDTRRPIDGTNEPRLFISDRCKNMIYAVQEWTGADGKTGATKDWIDLLRYFVLVDPSNVEGEALMVRRGNVR